MRYRQRISARRELVLLVVDSSGSTLRGGGLSAAKGVVSALLEECYQRRALVGLVQVSGREPTMRLLPRRAPAHTAALLHALQGGGGTPLRAGLAQALMLLARQTRRDPGQQQTLILLTDGRTRQALADLRPSCRTLLVDMERGPVALGRGRQLAHSLGAEYVALDALPMKGQAGV